MGKRVRIALTISGAISLGAYEGGALAALITALQAIFAEQPDDPPVRIDAIGGASAGSITAMLTARCLLAGLDPVQVMFESWVRDPSLLALRGTDPHSPLRIDQVRDSASKLLWPDDPKHRGRPKQRKDVQVWMALAALRGLNYRFGRLSGEPIEASTFLDYRTFTFTQTESTDEYLLPEKKGALDFALASGANALGFPPIDIDRMADRGTYVANGVTNFPGNGAFWYTDGGTINNEPLGQTLSVANAVDADPKDPKADPRDPSRDAERLLLLIHPHPESPVTSDQESWSDPAVKPAWTRTLIRSFQIQTTQSLFNDLRHVEKTNSRIDWTDRLADLLVDLVPETLDAQRQLAEFLAKISAEKAAIEENASDARAAEAEPSPAESPGAVGDLVREAIGKATGYGKKSEVSLGVISPLILPQAQTPGPDGKRPTAGDLLAGEFLHHFGGFVDMRFRIHDFALGYDSMKAWLIGKEGLASLGVDQQLVAAATAAVESKRDPGWETIWGAASMKDLPPPSANRRADLRAYKKLRRHILHVIWHEGMWHQLLGRNRQIFNP